MTRMKRIIVFGLLWTTLAAATAGVAIARSELMSADVRLSGPNIYSQALQKIESEKLTAMLLAQPTKTEAAGLSELQYSNPTFVMDLSEEIGKQTDTLRVCKNAAVPEMIRTTEYLEVSFLPNVATDGLLHLDDVAVERATFPTSQATNDCLVDAFQHMALAATRDIPTGRVRYELCFTNRHARQ